MNRVLKSADLVLMRDRESQSLLEQLAYHPPAGQVFETADCALNTVPSDQTRLRTILQKEGICQDSKPWVSFNLSSYIDVYVRAYKGKGIGKDNFLAIMAETIDRTMENLGVRVVLVITQPMDLTIAGEMLEKSCHRASIPLISNREYSYQDICAVFSAMTLHVGMRTHSLILASSVFTPVLGIIATPKNRGYMCSIDQQRRMVEFDNFTADSFARAVQDAWENRETIRAELRQSVAREKQKASGAADHLRPFLSAN
jgi:polysaccharide pyruvyl transferase WcaK-like protein